MKTSSVTSWPRVGSSSAATTSMRLDRLLDGHHHVHLGVDGLVPELEGVRPAMERGRMRSISSRVP